MDSYLSWRYERKVKCKESYPGFELRSLVPFPMTITIILSTPPIYFKVANNNHLSSSSSSWRAASTDIPDPLSPRLPIIHRLRQVFKITSRIISSHSCCMNVRAGRPAFDWPYVGVHRSTSLTISSLLLQQCPACLVRLACIVFVIGGRWPYSWRRVGCCCQDLFNIAHNILV